eukprot:g2735.t1
MGRSGSRRRMPHCVDRAWVSVSANELKIGQLCELDGKIFRVQALKSARTGKGGAFVQVDVREVRTGNRDTRRLRVAEKVERVVPEKTITLQKLYMGEGMVHCMDPETYEMVDLPEHLFDSSLQLLPDGDNISVQYLSAEEPLSVELPQNVVGVVAETAPHIPGARKTSDRKPAYLEHAPEVAVTVPGFVAIGDTISVNIQTRLYVERLR